MVSSGSAATRRRSAAAASAAAAASRAERATSGKKKRATPGRPGRNAQTASLHAKEAHEAEADALTSGIGQLEKFIERLRLIKSGTKPEPDESRDWLAPETLTAMTEVIDENPRPSLEYVLGVLGAQEVPKRLAERQRSQGARAFTAHLRNRAIRRKREAMEEKRKKAAEKPPLPPVEKKKGTKTEVKKADHADKPDASTKMPESRKQDIAGKVDVTANLRGAALPNSTATDRGPAKTAGAMQVEGIVKSKMVGENSDTQMKPVEQTHKIDADGKKSASDVALAEGATKLETAVKNGLGAIVSVAKPQNIQEWGSAVQSHEIDKADKVNKGDDAVMSDEEARADSAGRYVGTQSPSTTGKLEEIVTEREHVAKARSTGEVVIKSSIEQSGTETDAKRRYTSDAIGSRDEANERLVRTEQENQKKEHEKLFEAGVTEKVEEARKTAEVTLSKETMLRTAPQSSESRTGQQATPIRPGPDKRSDPDTVMGELHHLHESKARGADHSDENVNPLPQVGDGEESKGKTEDGTVVDAEKMEIIDSDDTRMKPIDKDDSMRGVPLKKREKTASEGKTRSEIKLPEGKATPASVAANGTGRDEGGREQSIAKPGATAADSAVGRGASVVAKEAGPAQPATDESMVQAEGQENIDEDVGTTAEADMKRKSDGAVPESATTTGSPQKREAMGMSSKGRQDKRKDGEREKETEVTKVTVEKKEEKQSKRKQGTTSEDKPTKDSEQYSPQEGTLEEKDVKKAVKKHGRSSMEVVDKDGGAQKATRKATGGPSKARKPKEAETTRERRVGARRLSYYRGDLVHSGTPQTRLRRESSHLRDPTSLPPDTDPFIVDCFHVWKTISQDKISIPFQKPVTKKDAPDYFDVIKHPMDLSTVRLHLEDKTIKTPQQFYNEMMLICSNALLFNDVNSDLYDLALELRHKIRKAVRPVLKQWRESEAAKEGTDAGASNAGQSDDRSRRSPLDASSSSESEDSSHLTDAASNQRGGTRYPSRRSGEGTSSATRPSGGRGRKRRGRGRGRGRVGRPRKTEDFSDLEDDGAVVVGTPGRGRGRGRRGGPGRRGGVTRENVGPGRKPKRGRPPADDDREDGIKKRRVSGRKRKDED